METEKSRQLFLFDVGAVLLELTYKRFVDAVEERIGKGNYAKFHENYKKIEVLAAKGQISPEEYLNELGNLLGGGLSAEAVAQLSSLRFGRQINEMTALKRRLHDKGYTVGIFSNTPKFDFETFGGRDPEIVETWGGPVIVSFKAGEMKDTGGMFEEIDRMGFKRVTYIDDNAAYANNGALRGWNSILFTPYIDPSETNRILHGNVAAGKDVRIARSFNELKKMIRDYADK